MSRYTHKDITIRMQPVTEYTSRKCTICHRPCQENRYHINDDRICIKCAMHLQDEALHQPKAPAPDDLFKEQA